MSPYALAQTTTAFVAQGVATLTPFFEQGLHLTKSQIGFTGGAVNVGMGLTAFAGRDQAGTAVGTGLTVIQLGVLGFPPLFGLLLDKSGSCSNGWVALSVLLCFGVILISRVKEQKAN